jgi:O-antigen/teichoic acid export membrane protein
VFTKIKRIFSTDTFKQSKITFTGTFVNGALGAVFYILAARFLGPSSYGLFTVAITALTLVADVGDLGTDTGLVNFVSRNIKKHPKKAKRFLKLGLEIKMTVSVLVLIIGLFFSGAIAKSIFLKPELTNPLKIASLGVGTFLLFTFVTSALQSLQRFWSWSLVQIGTNGLRLILFLLLIFFGALNLESGLVIYAVMPFLGFWVGIAIISPNFLKVKKETTVIGKFFKYNKWVAAFTLLSAVSSRLDIFISARLLDSKQVGIYSAANQLVTIVPQIVTAFGTVIGPKMASMGSLDAFVGYLKKTMIMVSGVALLGIVSIPVVSFLIPVVYGSDYSSAVFLFIILLLAMLIFLISVPIHMAVFYYFSKPSVFFWLGILNLGIISIVGWNLISTHGSTGAAFTVLISQIFNFVIPAIWVYKKILSLEKNR